MAHNWVYSIVIDAQGNKWFGTYDGGVSKLSNDNTGVVNSLTNIPQFDIFPNPTYIGIFKLSMLSAQSNDYTVNIYNHLGQKMITRIFSNSEPITAEFEISKFPKGMYLVELVTNSGKMTQKLIIE